MLRRLVAANKAWFLRQISSAFRGALQFLKNKIKTWISEKVAFFSKAANFRVYTMHPKNTHSERSNISKHCKSRSRVRVQIRMREVLSRANERSISVHDFSACIIRNLHRYDSGTKPQLQRIKLLASCIRMLTCRFSMFDSQSRSNGRSRFH